MNKGDVGGVVNCPAPFSGKAPPRAEPLSHLNHLFDETYMLKAKCAKDFKLADTDGSGFMDQSEMVNYLLTMPVGAGLPHATLEKWVRKMMQQYDTNQDGKLSLDEFLQCYVDVTRLKVQETVQKQRRKVMAEKLMEEQ